MEKHTVKCLGIDAVNGKDVAHFESQALTATFVAEPGKFKTGNSYSIAFTELAAETGGAPPPAPLEPGEETPPPAPLEPGEETPPPAE